MSKARRLSVMPTSRIHVAYPTPEGPQDMSGALLRIPSDACALPVELKSIWQFMPFTLSYKRWSISIERVSWGRPAIVEIRVSEFRKYKNFPFHGKVRIL